MILSVMKPIYLFMALAAVLAGLSAAGCKKLPHSKPASEWTEQEARGAAVYKVYCARCHYANNPYDLHGPGLQALYKQKYMPSGAPANVERSTQVILHGRGMMPATPLNDDQLADLLAYLKTL
jgi:mono/diheme cytochrome c family protein